MEGLPQNENLVMREALIENLKQKGSQDPEVKEELVRFVETLKAKRGDDYASTIRVTIEIALLFKDAALPSDANDLLEQAYQDAFQMQDDALCGEINGIIDSL